MKNSSFKPFLAAGLFTLAASAHAVIIEESWNWYDQAAGLGEGEYTVINDTTTDIFAFAVANDAPAGSGAQAYGSRVRWEAMTVTETQWDTGVDMYFWDGSATSIVSTADVGVFADLFPGYSSAFLYSYFMELSSSPIQAGTTERGFIFGSNVLASPFVTVNFNGNIIDAHDTVHVSPVPLPAAVWLFGAGLGLLGLAGRRRA